MSRPVRVVGIIPAHLASVRFPGKVLHPFAGLPMIEHVRRRALMSGRLAQVVVATCDDEIEYAVRAGGGEVVRTGRHHRNGTSRIAEALTAIDATHIVLLQGDEPLLLPRHIDSLVAAMERTPGAEAWNATGDINHPTELDRHSFVKCAIGSDDRILYCFRRSPSTAEFEVQRSYIRKILGLFAFTRESLLATAAAVPSVVESHESIEQMRIIEAGGRIISVPVDVALPSVNEPHEAEIVIAALQTDPEQRDLLARVCAG